MKTITHIFKGTLNEDLMKKMEDIALFYECVQPYIVELKEILNTNDDEQCMKNASSIVRSHLLYK